MKDFKDMTYDEKRAQVREMMPFVVEELMNCSQVITNNGEKACVIPVRFLNSYQISTESEAEIEAAIAEADEATTILGLRSSVLRGLKIMKSILVGKNEAEE